MKLRLKRVIGKGEFIISLKVNLLQVGVTLEGAKGKLRKVD